MKPEERVMEALRGGRPDKTPFTVYSGFLPQCETELSLRNRGICIVKRINSYRIERPNIIRKSHHFVDERGRYLIKTIVETPHGDMESLDEPVGFTTWHHKRMFTDANDYRALLYYIKDSVVVPDYDYVVREMKKYGSGFIIRDNLPLEPLQNMVSHFMGVETFCYEWMDNRDEVLKLYDALVEVARKIYPVVADGPLEFSNYGGNVIPKVIGEEVFRKYYVPHYNEAAHVLHKRGKLLGCHFDDDNTPIMDDIAKTDLDYIEAYDPGMSPGVSEARKVFKDKVLWINWPSSRHLYSPDEIRKTTVRLIEEASQYRDGAGFIIGITEDVPEDRWKDNFIGIMDGIDEYERNRGVKTPSEPG